MTREDEKLRAEFERILSPAIDARAPYAKVMIGRLVDAAVDAALTRAPAAMPEGWAAARQQCLDIVKGFNVEPQDHVSGAVSATVARIHAAITALSDPTTGVQAAAGGAK